MVKKLRITEATLKDNFTSQLYDAVEDIVYTAESNLAQQVASKVKGYDTLWDADRDPETLNKARDKYILELCAALLEKFDV